MNKTVLPQMIVERRIIILKSQLDSIVARLIGERVKRKLFTKFGFLKPKPEEIRLISLDKYYEPYIVVGGSYSIDYCKKSVYPIDIDENVQEVAFLDKKFKPESITDSPHSIHKVIKLDGVAFFHYEDKALFLLDKMGREIDLRPFPSAPSEEQTVETLTKKGIEFGEVNFSLQEEIDFLGSKIANRPLDIGEIMKEIFEVSERVIIYCPMYQLEFRNVKTGKEAIVRIDGNTGRTISAVFTQDFPMKDFVRDQTDNRQQVDDRLVEGEPELPEPPSTMDGVNSLEETDMISSKIVGSSQVSMLEIERKIEFPEEVVGEAFYVDDNATVEGDLKIPSGTIVYENIEVSGRLEIGTNCQILGRIEALRDVTIGANSKVDGNIFSGGDVIIASDSIIRGSVESIGHVEIGENAVIKGPLLSKSSVVLNSFAKVCAHD